MQAQRVFLLCLVVSEAARRGGGSGYKGKSQYKGDDRLLKHGMNVPITARLFNNRRAESLCYRITKPPIFNNLAAILSNFSAQPKSTPIEGQRVSSVCFCWPPSKEYQ